MPRWGAVRSMARRTSRFQSGGGSTNSGSDPFKPRGAQVRHQLCDLPILTLLTRPCSAPPSRSTTWPAPIAGLCFVARSRRSHQMRRIRLVTVSALVVLGLGTAACSSAGNSEPTATAKNFTPSAPPKSASTSTTAVPSTVAPTSAPPITSPSNPPTTTTTFIPPTTTVVPRTSVRAVPAPRRPPKPPPLRHCAPGSLGKTATLLGATVLCTHTATGDFWVPTS
jgi:hypothetical protein